MYGILGVSSKATDAEIKRAYRNLAREHHPDRGGDPARFKTIQNAYEVLSTQRQHYDQFGTARETHSSVHKSRDVRYTIDLTLEQLYSGVVLDVPVTRTRLCGQCMGRGGSDCRECGNCQGTGRVQIRRIVGMQPRTGFATCGACSGRGTLVQAVHACDACRGKGTVNRTDKVRLDVPPYTRPNTTLRVDGQGLHETPNDEPGDCLVVVHQRPHPVFERGGEDLRMTVELSLAEALCGWTRKITTVDGAHATVGNVGLTRPTDVFRMEGKGMRGDLFVAVKIKFPTESEIQPVRHMLARSMSYDLPTQPVQTPMATSDAFRPDKSQPTEQQQEEPPGMECQVQ